MRFLTCKEWKLADVAGKRVLAVFAHPDDGDFYFGGTVARLVSQGAHVSYLCATRGDKGDACSDKSPADIAGEREFEQRAAASLLGVEDVEFIGLPDGRVVYGHDLIREIVQRIRRLKPDIVLTLDTDIIDRAWGVNHADHRAVALATFDAVYPYARNQHEFAELGLPAHVVTDLLSVSSERANCFVRLDASAFARKLRALGAHKSQWGNNQRGVQAARQQGRRETFLRLTWNF